MTNMQKTARREERHQRVVAKRAALRKAQEDSEELDAEDIREVIQGLTDDPVKVEIREVVEGASDGDIDTEAGDVVEDLDEVGEDEEAQELQVAGIPHSDEPEVAPELKKDYYSGGPEYQPTAVQPAPIGATSWGELDAERVAEDQSRQVRLASYDTEGLVRNILDHPIMDAADKATAIQAVGAGFQDRIDMILEGAGPVKKEKEIEVLEIEAMLAVDRRHTSAVERMGDWINKAVLTTAGRNKLSAGEFALVVDRGGKKVKKYPIHDKAHVRNALARAAQMMNRGGQAAADAKAALPKIHAAAKRMGIGSSKEKSPGAILVQKDMAGEWRWVGITSNNFQDWHGDIISKAAHEEYVAFLDANPDMSPMFRSWHTPGTERKSHPDFWTYENGFLIMSGKLTEGEAASLFKAQAKTDLGMSFEGFGLRNLKDPRVIEFYRPYEVSDLPLDAAANPFTDFSVIVKEVDMGMNKAEYLATILGSKENAEAFIARTGMKKEQLEQAGVESKSKTPAAPATTVVVNAPNVPTPEKIAAAAASAQAAKPGNTEAVVEAVIKALEMDALSDAIKSLQETAEKVPLLEAVIKDLSGNQDAKLAAQINPPAARFAWASKQRASEDTATVVGATDEIVKKAPGLGPNWLSEVTHTQPLAAEPTA